MINEMSINTDISVYGNTERLLEVLNSNDSMSITLRIINNKTIIRTSPNNASNAVHIASEDDEFETNRQWKGWFFIPSVRGWVYYTNVMIAAISNGFDPEFGDDFDFEDGGTNTVENVYNAKDIITSIINSIYKIPTSSIVHRRYDDKEAIIEETLLSVLIEEIFDMRDELQSSLERIGNMPKIPGLEESENKEDRLIGLTLVTRFNQETKKYEVSWENLDYDKIKNAPNDESVTDCEF